MRSLVLAPVGGAMLRTVTPSVRAFFDAEQAALEAGDLDAAMEANIAAWVAGEDRSEREVPAGVADRVREMQRCSFASSALIGDPADDPFTRAAALAVPPLMIVGGQDMDAVREAAAQWAEELPDAHLEWWANVAHLPSMEQPDRFVERVAAWRADRGVG